ncbi:MAG: tetratricopeptide repeat protein [Betaproteobacteria bacterium]|nr:tetratricopeptide repeat protein [Betaproteobacteria bacterium]
MKRSLIILNLLVLIAMGSALAEDNDSAARRYLQRGLAAVEMAKTSEDFLEAAKEFRSAIELAPGSTVAWYNLGAVLEKAGDIPGAMAALKRYVELAPQAGDAAQVRDKLVRLEYRLERASKQQNLEGNWYGDERTFRLTIKGNEFRLQSEAPVAFDGSEVSPYFKDMFGSFIQRSPKATGSVSFAGRLDGNRITGERQRAAFVEGVSGCQIPEQRTAVEGRLEEDGKLMVLTFDVSHYRANWTGVFWGLESCLDVSIDKTERHKLQIRRQTAP